MPLWAQHITYCFKSAMIEALLSQTVVACSWEPLMSDVIPSTVIVSPRQPHAACSLLHFREGSPGRAAFHSNGLRMAGFPAWWVASVLGSAGMYCRSTYTEMSDTGLVQLPDSQQGMALAYGFLGVRQSIWSVNSFIRMNQTLRVRTACGCLKPTVGGDQLEGVPPLFAATPLFAALSDTLVRSENVSKVWMVFAAVSHQSIRCLTKH
jgi:hypothetical protein